MKKSKILICVLAFLLVSVPVFQVRAAVSVAFIYSTDLTSAESYEALLTSRGFAVDLVPSSDATTWNYGKYGLIIIGAETGAFYQWEPEAAVSVIDETGKPILGLGIGGSCFFSVLELYIDWGQGWSGSEKSLYVVDSGHQIFQSPTRITVPSDKIIDVYSGSTKQQGIYMPSPVAGITPLGREVGDSDHYSLIQQEDRYVLWGFGASPAAMTQTGKNLFTNVVSWLAPQSALQNPSASFTSSPASPKVDETVTFNASGSTDADGTIDTYSWNFGDGTTGTGKTATHSYTSAGARNVSLTVTDNDGLEDTAAKTITISPADKEPPVASFTSSPASPKVDETVTFNASGSTDADGTIDTYSWDFDDGDTATGKTTTHSYSSAGTYTVTLTVTDNDELTGTATKDVVVTEGGGDGEDTESPVANAGNSQTVNTGSQVTFSAASSTDNVGITSYSWNFGDGSTGTGVTASHTYATAGTYTVTLTVGDAAGNSDTVTIVITVKEAAAGFPYWILIPIIIAIVVVAVVVWYFLKKRKPKEKTPKPSKIRVTVDPTAIMADGSSTSTLTIELLDSEGKPVSAVADTEITLVSSLGQVKKPVVKIPKGKVSEKTGLVASKETGTATVSADAKNLDRAVITVTFLEKKRYCMHCGSKMTLTAKRCPQCGKSPPAGVDTKTCKNCEAVIPAVANFCAECGASQPKETQ
jgi:PKD repeat protein/ribosomal protein L40E